MERGQPQWTEPPFILHGTAHEALARAVAKELHVAPRAAEVRLFPDGELSVRIGESVRGARVFLVQPTCPPADRNLLELILLADACRRAGASEITALIPYFAYARQDRRAKGREALGARVVCDQLAAAHLDRIVSVDVHSPALEGFCSIPFEHLSAFPTLLGGIGDAPRDKSVVVAPDFGAAKLADRFARALALPVAFVRKQRLDGAEVTADQVIGDVRGCAPILVDDMISTGATLEAATRALLEAGCAPSFTIIATHGLFSQRALERLARLPVERVIVTDSVPYDGPTPVRLDRVSIAPLLAQALSAILLGQSLEPIAAHA